MQIAITIVGVVGVCVLLISVACLMLALVAKCFELAARDTIKAAQAEEKLNHAQHYATTAWWFSEYPDVQHALALVAEEINTGRRDSSQLRSDWLRKTGRKP